jgi:ABC-type dipeptide/oligopeptide/nickel transport system ATPase component
MDSDKKLLRYFLRSHIDSDHSSLNMNHGVNLSLDEVKSGKLTEESLELIKKKSSNIKSKGELEYHICPVILSESDSQSVILPFFIIAKLNEQRLVPISQRPPYFVRQYLEPSSKDNEITIGTIEKNDDYVEKHPYLVEENWIAAWKYAENMFQHVTGKNFRSLKLPGYRVSNQVCIIPKELENKSRDILSLYEDVIKLKKYPKLLQEFLSLDEKEKEPIQHEKDGAESHLGQMNSQYPLSQRQRESLQHLFSLKKGEILAVNGPPGTGKTTLIQNVVASLWVEKAIEGGEPPVIFATSTNNQAIINVIDSFGKMNQGKTNSNRKWGELAELLQGRWIQPLKSYGLYFPSSKWLDNNKNKVNDYQIVTQNGMNFMKDMEKMNMPVLKKAFLNHCGKAAGQKFHHLKEACKWLHEELNKWHQVLQEGIQYIKSWVAYQEELKKNGRGYFSSELEDSRVIHKEQLDKQIKQLKMLKTEWNQHCSKEPFHWSLLSFIPAIKEKQERRNENFILKWKDDLPFEVTLFSKMHIQQQLDNCYSRLEKYKDAEADLINWRKKYGIGEEPEQIPDSFSEMMEELDVSLRYLLFQLATHYWEARWLLEVENDTESKLESKEKKANCLRRYAMLAPCFVATFYMIARHLKLDNKWGKKSFANDRDPNYLYEFVDLLIIDEAGQVTPPLAAPVFSLAKKALIVGDTMQIEPISNLNLSIDIGNLLGANIIKRWDQFSEIEKTGITHRGSVMRIAQRRSKYQKEEMYGGMFLNEHRRCVDDIIQYCNDLAYNGNLMPLRGNSMKYHDIPYLGYAHIEGETEEIGGSKFNLMEAAAVAEWIAENKHSILRQAQKTENKKSELKDLVGVVTPFRYQRTLIQEFLKELGVKNITVGTVHELQGAERDIILFSPVDHESNRPFYDQGINMLNVAVSRARESFLVFTDWNKFGNVRQFPSGKLKQYISHEDKLFERTREEQTHVDRLFERIARKSGKKNSGKQTIIQQIIIHRNQGQINIAKDGKMQVSQVVNKK